MPAYKTDVSPKWLVSKCATIQNEMQNGLKDFNKVSNEIHVVCLTGKYCANCWTGQYPDILCVLIIIKSAASEILRHVFGNEILRYISFSFFTKTLKGQDWWGPKHFENIMARMKFFQQQ